MPRLASRLAPRHVFVRAALPAPLRPKSTPSRLRMTWPDPPLGDGLQPWGRAVARPMRQK
eukprot:scaffold1457_cov350-Prasinococcus_capsulatus_cf.AAC.12